MKALFLSILAVISLVAACHKHPTSKVDQLLGRIRAELPKGWTASYEKEYAWLEISRDEPVLSVSALPNSDPWEKPKRAQFVFAFRVGPAVAPSEYRRLTGERARIQKEATRLYEELIRRSVDHRFDRFFPSTVEDEKTVQRYEALKKSLPKLPDFYFADISLQWGFNSPENPMTSVIDESIRIECKLVQETVVALLSRYEGA